MNLFLKKTLLWFFFAIIFACILDLCVSTGLRKTGIRKYAVWSDIFDSQINADLLVIGSSRAWCGYNTFILDSLLKCNSYNLGIDGHPFDMQLIRYQTYRRFNPPPKTILLNVDFLSTLDNSSDDEYEREQFFPFIRDKQLINQVKGLKHITTLDRFLPLVRYYGYREDLENGLESFGGRKSFDDAGLHKGYRGNTFQWERGMVLDKDTLITLRIDYTIANQIDSFLKESSEEGIQIVLVKSPLFAPLMQRFNNIYETDSVYSNLANKHSIPILDFYNARYCSDTSFFCNPSHLNKAGSEIFTIDLCQTLIENQTITFL